MESEKIIAVIFDMDGTLIDSNLDFEKIRQDCGIPKGEPILEFLQNYHDKKFVDRAMSIVHGHEMSGAINSTLMANADNLLANLKEKQIPTALLTRNSREVTEYVIEKFQFEFDYIVSRDDAPAKPDPQGILNIIESWNLSPNQCVYVGDFKFDIETAKNAGTKSALLKNRFNLNYSNQADFALNNLIDLLAHL